MINSIKIVHNKILESISEDVEAPPQIFYVRDCLVECDASLVYDSTWNRSISKG